jgi:hypothetical protein
VKGNLLRHTRCIIIAILAEHGLGRVKKNAEEAYVVPKGIASKDTVIAKLAEHGLGSVKKNAEEAYMVP